MKILLCDNGMRGLLNFRGAVIRHFLSKGYDVVAVYPKITHEESLICSVPTGCRCVQCSMIPTGMNPVSDVKLFFELLKIYKTEKPDIVFHYTIKPNVYGTLAARCCGVKTVAMVAGLGYIFTGDGFKQRMGRWLYKFGLNKAHRVLTLNRFIYDKLLGVSFARKEQLILLKGGEGVDLSLFDNREDTFGSVRFLMVARVLIDKGYREYIQAAKIVKSIYPGIRIELLGPLDEKSPMGISKEELEKDIVSGTIKYLGVSNNVPAQLCEDGTVVVLPSYHEGLSMSLIEACAAGRPIITSEIPGCRETVDDGKNGFLVAVKDAESLATAMMKFIELSQDEKQKMARLSREKAENTFDVKYVFDVYDRLINDFLN